jgi:hypothetical protein
VWFYNGITLDQITIYGTLGTAIVLIIIIYFTRATRLRIAGALAAGLLIILTDFIASSLGLWHYPGYTSGIGPIGYYIPTALFYGAGMALIGWRINRRFGMKGLAVFIILFGLYGSTRDYIYATSSSNVIIFGMGIVHVIADYLAWIGILIIAQIVMWLVAGPAKDDRLARTKNMI